MARAALAAAVQSRVAHSSRRPRTLAAAVVRACCASRHVLGGKDHQVPVANVGYLRTQLAAAGKSNLFEPLVFPDYNHFIPWEHPDAVEAAIRVVTGRLSGAAQNQ